MKSVAGTVLLCVAIVVIVVVIVCGAVYLGYVNKQGKVLAGVRSQGGGGRPPPRMHHHQEEPFENPKEMSYSRVGFQHLPGTVTRTILNEAGPSLDLLHNFLTPDECKHLVALANGRFKPSSVVDPATGVNVPNPDRTSNTVFLDAAEDEVVRRVERRAALSAGVPLENFERLQVVRYEPGQFYKAHFDYLEDSVPDLKKVGQRAVTIFAYLNDLAEDEPGGGTKFHAIGKTVTPKMGTAALWYNMVKDPTTTTPRVDPTTLHSGEPVAKSIKFGLNIWARTKPQRGVAK